MTVNRFGAKTSQTLMNTIENMASFSRPKLQLALAGGYGNIYMEALDNCSDAVKKAEDVSQGALQSALYRTIDETTDEAGNIQKSSDEITQAFKKNADDVLKEISEGGSYSYKEIKTFTAEEANQWFIDNVKKDYKPPYKPGTVVKEIELRNNTTFVRVYDNLPDGSGMYGS